MNESRRKVLIAAFDVLDANKVGKVDITQIKAKHNPAKHPAVLEGRKTDKQILEEFNSSLDLYLSTYNIGDAMTKDDFIDFYWHISFTVDNDEYFNALIKNSWNLEATIASAAFPTPPPIAKKSPDEVEIRTFGSESRESPLKKSVAQVSAEQPLVKPVQIIAVEAPYYTQEEEKKGGNVISEKFFQKTDTLVLNRLRTAILSRNVRGIIGLERQFAVYAKNGLIELDDLKKSVEDFRLPVESKDLTVLFKALDSDMDSKVSCTDLIRAVIGDMNPRRAQLVEQAFKVIDKDNDGVISKSDLSRSLDGLKHPDVKQGRKTQEDLLKEITDILDLSISIRVRFLTREKI